jgi:hypothetical protein
VTAWPKRILVQRLRKAVFSLQQCKNVVQSRGPTQFLTAATGRVWGGRPRPRATPWSRPRGRCQLLTCCIQYRCGLASPATFGVEEGESIHFRSCNSSRTPPEELQTSSTSSGPKRSVPPRRLKTDFK